MTGPRYVVRDNLLGRMIGDPTDRHAAGDLATGATFAARERGESVVASGGIDRFTVQRCEHDWRPDATCSLIDVCAIRGEERA